MPPPFKIGLHQEMAYMPAFPRLVAFYCRQPADAGGETPICDMRRVTARVPAALRERFAERGVMYLRTFAAPGARADGPRRPSGHAVRRIPPAVDDAFGTTERDEVERLRGARRRLPLARRRQRDGVARRQRAAHASAHRRNRVVQPGERAAPEPALDGRASYRYLQRMYGGRAAFPYEIRYGDGSPMPFDDLVAIYDAFDDEERAFPWQAGDVLVVDNMLVAHGRNPYRARATRRSCCSTDRKPTMSDSFLASVRARAVRPAHRVRPATACRHATAARCALARCGARRARDRGRGRRFPFSARHVRFRLGAITAIVGPNGSGKTTLLETLLGFRRGGTDVRVLDVPAARFMRDTPSLRRIGAQLQKVEYPDHLRVSEIVALHRAMYVRVDAAVTDALGIAELLDKPCRALSKGQRQRIDLYVALAHRPELAVLDEPFTGLDRRYAGVVIDLLRDRARGTSVAMICHAEEELAVVDDLVWVRDGGVRYQATRTRCAPASSARRARSCIAATKPMRARCKRLAALPGVTGVRVSATHVVEVFGDATLHPNVHRIVGEQGIQHLALAPSTPGDLLRLCTEAPPMTKVFLILVRNELLGYLRSRSSLFWTLVFPVFLLSVMLFAFGGSGRSAPRTSHSSSPAARPRTAAPAKRRSSTASRTATR